MNSRERVAMALNFEEPDRPPVAATFVPEMEALLRSYTGIDEPDLGVGLGNDQVKDCVGIERSFYSEPRPEYVCPWGIRWRYVGNQFGEFTEIVEHPLAGDMSKLDGYHIPNPNEAAQYQDFRAMKERYGKEKWLVGSSQVSIFEAAWYLRGLEQLLEDLLLEPDYVHALMDKVMEFPRIASQKYIELGADMVWFGDDVSDQRGMIMSPDTWRTFLKPRYARLFAECKRLNPNVKIAYHSCGNVEAVVDELVEIGLDVLNPVQPAAIDPIYAKKRFGKNLVLYGGMCVQHVMPHGSPEEVRATVRQLKQEVGAGGGFILSPAHHVQADTPIENVLAFYQEGLQVEAKAGA